ncbi:MAG: endoglucanase [Myxococcota bacterium]
MIGAQRFGRGIVLATSVTALVAAASCIDTQKNGDDGVGQGGLSQGTGGSNVNTSGGVSSGQGGQTSLGSGGSNQSSGGQSTSAGGSGSGGASNSSGGSSNTSTGGAAAGGASAGSGSGGAASSCTDLPPNNGDTCAHAVEYGWCKESWLGTSCQKSCGKCSGSGAGGTTGSSGGSTGTGSGGTTGTVDQPPRIENGMQGWASRYWDCCKPACGWKGNVPGGSTPVASCNAQGQSLGGNYDARNACESGGTAYMCQNYSPWAVSDTLAYGFAAVSKGSDYCGRCYQLQFTGGSHNASVDAGSQSLSNKTMIVQAINNGGVGGDQFDLLIPGGGVGDFDACSGSWGTSDLGERYGGFFLDCQKKNGFNHAAAKTCTQQKCQTVFANKPDLMAGCTWFLTWFNAPDNPALVYKEVACPAAITARSGLKR